ncbi:kinase-like domain-containing protein [Xylariaceae sp. FL1019]|nr:kinase-like domain-containing protein [Xylariaceae sp. FL1019]
MYTDTAEKLVQVYLLLFRLYVRLAEEFKISLNVQETINDGGEAPDIDELKGQAQHIFQRFRRSIDHAHFGGDAKALVLFEIAGYLLRVCSFWEYNSDQTSSWVQLDVQKICSKIAGTIDELTGRKFYDITAFQVIAQAIKKDLDSIVELHWIQQYQHAEQVPYKAHHDGEVTYESGYIVRKATYKHHVVGIKLVCGPDIAHVARELEIRRHFRHRNVVFLENSYRISKDSTIYLVLTPWAPYTVRNFITEQDVKRNQSCPWIQPNVLRSNLVILRILKRIAQGIDYIHRWNIEHTDLKPENILLCQTADPVNVRPVITGFYHSRDFEPGDRNHRTESPDIWHLGCCFAMIAVVSRGRLSRMKILWPSFNEKEIIPSIAMDIDKFTGAFGRICGHGLLQQQLFKLIMNMLDVEPSSRIGIKGVLGITTEVLRGLEHLSVE